MSESFRLYLLGGFRLDKDGARIQLYSRKVESLLAYLALYPQEHAREKLAALLWGDSSDEQARGSLRLALNNLRKQLGSDSILSDRETVQLNPDFSLWTDSKEIFDLRFVRQTPSLSDFPNQASQQIINQKSTILNYSELLPDFYDDWLETPREELRALFLDAALKLIDHARTQSEYKTAIELAQKILTVDKANEAAHQHLMFCYSALGDRAAALDQYEFCKRALKEELGIEPSQETRALYKLILSQTETKSAAARLTNLPRPTTSFIGREKEIEEIGGMLRGEGRKERGARVSPLSSLLTLTGPGGSGKTRLAIEIGSQLVAEFPDGVWWVDLSALQDETFVPNHVAKALGVQEQPNVPILETLQANLSAKHLLLVLDNCEHVTKGAAHLVEALVSTCPLTILATSRERLNVAGELTYQVSTLATPKRGDTKLTPSELLAFEAVKLFAERARSHQPIFRLNEQNAPHVIRICQQLDGIPLALELAAAQIQSLSLDEIAARLGQRRELIDATRAHSRQQTLHALIGWSYDLLSPVEQVLFRRLGVFAGGWTLEQAIVVAGGYENADAQWNTTEANTELSLPITASFVVSALLHNLVSKSLVLVESERYHFLETIREYAREKLVLRPSRLLGVNSGEGLEAGESDAFDKRHYAYFVQLVETAEPQLRGNDRIAWFERLEIEQPNLRAALDWALAQPDANLVLRLAGDLQQFWRRRNYAKEGLSWYEKALSKSDAHSNPLYVGRAYSGIGLMVSLMGEYDKAYSLHEQALGYFERAGDQNGIASALYYQGGTLYWRGEVESAELFIQRALRIAQAENIKWLASLATNFMGILSMATGDQDAALEYYGQARALAQSGGDMYLDAVALHNMGCIESERGNFARADALFTESLRLTRACNDNSSTAANLIEQGLLLIRQGQYEAAAQVCGEAAQLTREFAFKDKMAQAIHWYAAAIGYQQEFERAAQLWGAAAALHDSINAKIERSYRPDYDKAVAYVRAQMGDERFAELFSQGREMNMEQVQELMVS